METVFLNMTSQARRFARWLIAPFVAFFIAGDIYLFGYVALHHSEIKATVEQQIKDDIDTEDHAVCAELGLASGSAFDACSEALARVRQRHEERLESFSPF